MVVAREREEISVEGAGLAISHYTDAVRFGDLLFVSGIAAIDEHGTIMSPGDVVGQTKYILEMLQKVLEKVGSGYEDVLKVTVYLIDVADRTKINTLRQEFFGEAKPASTLIGVKALALPGLEVEIEAIVGLRAQ